MSTPPPDDVQYLDLADYLWLAGAALGRAPETVFDVADLGLAESALHAPAAADVDATIDMMVKIAGSQVEPGEVEGWIRWQLR